MKKLLVLGGTLLLLVISGCMQDDVQDLKTMAETQQEEAYKAYYSAGIRDGMMACGVPEEEAVQRADQIAGVAFE